MVQTRTKVTTAGSQKTKAIDRTSKTKSSQRLNDRKSALRPKARPPFKGGSVRFELDQAQQSTNASSSSALRPASRNGGDGPHSNTSVLQQIGHSKRAEREKLLKRAAKFQEKARTGAEVQAVPSQSAKSKILSSFPKSLKIPEEVNKRVKFNSKRIDIVQDDIPGSRGEVHLPEAIHDVATNSSHDIKLEDICAAFDMLKRQIQYHCRDFYTFEMPSSGPVVPFFTTMKVQYPELFRYIQRVADGSQYGWDRLLTVTNQRENLVYAIISRAIVAYIFDAELFGASKEHEQELLDMCREYLNFDAFVRNKHRAEIIARVLATNADNAQVEDGLSYFRPAIESLSKRLHILLTPLLNLGSTSSSSLSSSPQSPSRHKSSLATVIETAHKIHLSIRLHGQSGTVFRFENMQKKSHWDPTTMDCVNKSKVDLTAHHGPQPLVKLPCFPAVFAYTPSGPTLESFQDEDFVRKWQQEADDQGSKPVITTYPITLAHVVLENTPIPPLPPSSSLPSSSSSSSSFPPPPSSSSSSSDTFTFQTLSEAMAKEQSSLSDTHLYRLTGINRARNKRVTKTISRAKKAVRVAGTAAATVGLANLIVAAGSSLRDSGSLSPFRLRVSYPEYYGYFVSLRRLLLGRDPIAGDGRAVGVGSEGQLAIDPGDGV